MNPNHHRLIAALSIIFLASAWHQFELVARHIDRTPRGAVDGGRDDALRQPSSLSAANRTRSDHKDETPPPRDAFLLQRSDSLYRKYNISTTPIVIEKYKLLFFCTEKIGSTVLKQLLRRMMGHEDYWFHGDGIPHIKAASGLRVLTDYALKEANGMLTSDAWTRAMFVRDPKERVLSGYLMWRPVRVFPPKLFHMAQQGLLNESVVKGPNVLGKCCRDRAKGNFHDEMLCMQYMRKFEDFLDMIEDPVEDETHDRDRGVEYQRPNKTLSTMSRLLRASQPCPDKHWSPVTQWRMERKFYPSLNFIGHLESAQQSIRRLLDRLHPDAWDKYGASGWGRYRNESMFASSGTVNHARRAERYLLEHYTREDIERRVEKIFGDDYDNEFLHLERVPIGEAQSFYRQRFLERYGAAAAEQG